MKFFLFCFSIILSAAYISCTEEAQPVFITGTWDAIYFERVDCRDSLDNLEVDLMKDSVYNIDGSEVRFNAYTMRFFDNGSFEQEINKTVNGIDVAEASSGKYLSSGFNDIIFCKNECSDSLFKYGLYVRVDNQLDLNWIDTLDLGCSVVFQGVLK